MSARPRGIFVTGTDTGVGKTVIAGMLAAWCRARNIDAGVMKPVATGAVRGRGTEPTFVSGDARYLMACAGSREHHGLVTPFLMREPLAPVAAAEREGRRIRLDSILGAFWVLAYRHDLMIVEGIGGVLVPLNSRADVADLIQQLRLPVLVVARPGLGTLNHTLLTLSCLRARRIPVAGLVVHASRPAERDPHARVIERTNLACLKRAARVVGVVPYLSRADQPGAAARHGARWTRRYFDRRFLTELSAG